MKLIEKIKKYLNDKKEQRKIKNYFKNLQYREYKVRPQTNSSKKEEEKEGTIDKRSIRKLAKEKEQKLDGGQNKNLNVIKVVRIDINNGYGYRYEYRIK